MGGYDCAGRSLWRRRSASARVCMNAQALSEMMLMRRLILKERAWLSVFMLLAWHVFNLRGNMIQAIKATD